MNIVYHIAGYDRQTSSRLYRYDVSEDNLPGVMQAACISMEATAEFGPVLLDPATVENIARRLNKTFYSESCDWVLEPFDGSHAGVSSPLPHYRV